MPMNRADYPADWEAFSKRIRFGRAGAQCECMGECGLHGRSLFHAHPRRCIEQEGKPAKWAKGKIVLTVAHLNAAGGPCSCAPLCAIPEHVKAMCQRCHLRYDADRHQATRLKRGGEGVSTWTAVIPEVPPSANPFMRTHFRARKEKKSVWYALLYGAFFHEGITKAKGKRAVTITIRSKQERDEANLYLATDKLILDNLKALGWIVDDSPKWIELTLKGEVGEPRTVIEVQE